MSAIPADYKDLLVRARSHGYSAKWSLSASSRSASSAGEDLANPMQQQSSNPSESFDLTVLDDMATIVLHS